MKKYLTIILVLIGLVASAQYGPKNILNASKLGGYPASHFAPISRPLLTNSIRLGNDSIFQPDTLAWSIKGVRLQKKLNGLIFGPFAGNAAYDHAGNHGFGYYNLNVLGVGQYNTTGGYVSGASITSGSYNSLWGSSSGSAINTGSYNVGMGTHVLDFLTSGTYNTGVGYYSNATTNTYNCVTIGAFAGKYNVENNVFYVDALDRTNTAGDKAGALFYGKFNATPSSQILNINADTYIKQGGLALNGVAGNGLLFGPSGTGEWLFEMNGDNVRLFNYNQSKYTWIFDGATSAILPATDNDVDVGSVAKAVKAVVSHKNQTVATDTTGVGSTANIGTMMYYNGHFYGLKAGTPPTWVQLDN